LKQRELIEEISRISLEKSKGNPEIDKKKRKMKERRLKLINFEDYCSLCWRSKL